MCTQAKVLGEYVEDTGHLMRLIPREQIAIKEMYGDSYELDGKECLCPVDFEKTAERAGLVCKETDDPWWQYELVR